MAVTVLMPKIGISVETCLIGAWRKKVGERVSVGETLFTYETDKAAFECESTAGGTLLEIFYGDGEEAPVLTPVCAVGEPGEDVSALRVTSPLGEVTAHPRQVEVTAHSRQGDAATTPTGVAAEQTPVAAAAAHTSGDVANAPIPVGDMPAQAAAASAPAAAVFGAGYAGISPRARRLAERLGVDAAVAVATGPLIDGGRRVIERDIEALIAAAPAQAVAAAEAAAAPATAAATAMPTATTMRPDLPAAGGYADTKLPPIRRAIASAMTKSLSEMAQLTHHHSFDATCVLALRARFKQSGAAYGVGDVTLGDIVLFAVSRVLPRYPDLNAHLLDGAVLRRFERVHLGVAIDTERGLMVPTVFDADKKTLLEISSEVKALAAAARSGSISPDLLRGGTFTVSNLGTTGVEMFTPIINPPQTAILGVCGMTTRVREAPDGGIKTYPAIGLSLTYDHRAADGAPASRFAQALAAALEQIDVVMAY